MGLVYLVQPSTLLNTNRYKIGCSSKQTLERIKSYGKKVRCLHICETEYFIEIEKNIKQLFNTKFKLIAGTEYFEGNEKEIKEMFIKEIQKYEKEKEEEIDTKHKGVYNCSRCGYETYNSFILKRHFTRKNICKQIYNNMTQEELIKDFEDKNKKYTCEKCNQSFENSNKKYRHKQKCNSFAN